MYLLLGSQHDPCCAQVYAALESRGYRARIVENLLAQPTLLSWRLDSDQSASELCCDGGEPLLDDEINGVLVRDVGWVNPQGWQSNDLAYVQAEIQAALLGWLWSLGCPVVNRYEASIWYRPQLSLLSWRRLLWRSGLQTLDALISSVEGEARAFGQPVANGKVAGTVYRPLTSTASYLVANDREWVGLAAMQQRAPVSLTHAHGQPQSACVIAERVVWDGAPPPDAAKLERALCRFAASAGLTFVEIVLAEASHGLSVVGVEHRPHFERFGATARTEIVAAVVDLFTANATVAAAPPVAAKGQGA